MFQNFGTGCLGSGLSGDRQN